PPPPPHDSGGNLAQLREVYQGPVKTFSIGFKGNPWSELPHSRQITQQYGTDHYEYIIDGHEIEYLPEIVRAFADPFQESGLMVNLCATKLLVGDHKVPSLLCGEGNDQLFGTAPKDLAWHYMANKTGLAILQKKIFTLFNQKPFLPGNLLFKLQFHNDKILHILCSDRFGFKAAEKRQLLKDYPGPSPFICADRTGKTSRDFTDLYLRKTYFTDLQQQTNEVIVYKAANSARLYGIDPAFPLLDLDIYRFITRLPVSFKMHGSPMQLVRGKGINKYLYKVSLSGKLPGQAVQRKKQGGFAPMVIFFEDESRRKRILEYITRSDMAKTLLNQDVLVTYFDQFCHDIRDQKIWFWYYQFRCFQLFSLLILAIWWDQFINNRVFTKLSDYIGVEVK
ncbi:MAG: asparagine synthase, partial [Bacteroidia bacterium]|nr:asparagine synthase [Bacteroidia bacterium]